MPLSLPHGAWPKMPHGHQPSPGTTRTFGEPGALPFLVPFCHWGRRMEGLAWNPLFPHLQGPSHSANRGGLHSLQPLMDPLSVSIFPTGP